MNGDMVKVDDDSFIVKVRGLPYSATAHDVALFFSGCDIKGGKAEGVSFLFNPQTGQFTQGTNAAVERDRSVQIAVKMLSAFGGVGVVIIMLMKNICILCLHHGL